MKYRKLYNELQERSNHYKQMMDEYEKLYTEFLKRAIVKERENLKLRKKVNRVENIVGLCGVV